MSLLPVIPRGLLKLTGADRVRFLHGMTTNHVKALKPGEAQKSLHVSQKGKVLALLTVYAEADALWVETDADRVAWLKAAFEKMLIMDDVAIEDHSAAIRVLARTGAEPPPSGLRVHACRIGGEGWELWVPATESAPSADPSTLSATQEEALRIANGMPRFGVDVTEENLPQEAGLDEDTGWISYAKGCYVGQETIARLHSLGQVQQRLVRLRFPGGKPAAPGSALTAGGQAAGKVTSACLSPEWGAIGLGMVRRAFLAPGTVLEAEGRQIELLGAKT